MHTWQHCRCDSQHCLHQQPHSLRNNTASNPYSNGSLNVSGASLQNSTASRNNTTAPVNCSAASINRGSAHLLPGGAALRRQQPRARPTLHVPSARPGWYPPVSTGDAVADTRGQYRTQRSKWIGARTCWATERGAAEKPW
eukprot:2384958-Rhodomonas_salina.2